MALLGVLVDSLSAPPPQVTPASEPAWIRSVVRTVTGGDHATQLNGEARHLTL